MSIPESKNPEAPLKFEIDLAEYVRDHAQTIMKRAITDDEIEQVIHEHLFDSNGIHNAVYDAVVDYHESTNKISPHLPAEAFGLILKQ